MSHSEHDWLDFQRQIDSFKSKNLEGVDLLVEQLKDPQANKEDLINQAIAQYDSLFDSPVSRSAIDLINKWKALKSPVGYGDLTLADEVNPHNWTGENLSGKFNLFKSFITGL